jgi:hypothetical protein
MKIEKTIELLFALKQARAAIDLRLEEIDVAIKNAVLTGEITKDTELRSVYGTARWESRPSYDVSKLELRDALKSGALSFDELMESDCISFRGAEIAKTFDSFVVKTEKQSLIVRLDSKKTIEELVIFDNKFYVDI